MNQSKICKYIFIRIIKSFDHFDLLISLALKKQSKLTCTPRAEFSPKLVIVDIDRHSNYNLQKMKSMK